MGEFTTKGIHFKKHSDAEVIEALRATHGIMSQAAKLLGLGSAGGLRNRINAKPKLYEVMMEARSEIVDLAETVMVQKLQMGDPNMAQFVLRTLGRDRGYITENVLTGTMDTRSVVLNYDFDKLTLEQKLSLEKAFIDQD